MALRLDRRAFLRMSGYGTAADILGEQLPDNTAEDSVSLLPDFLGTARAPVREAVVHHSINGSFSIRRGRWKLELCPGSGGWSYPQPEKAQELGAKKTMSATGILK